MTTKRVLLTLLLAVVVSLPAASAVLADATSNTGHDYVVQAGDWLARIAQDAYGDYGLYPAVVLATNKLAVTDASYATIADPFVIEPGDKLYLPDLATAQAGLTLTGLENAAYPSEWAADGVARLIDGSYEAEIAPGSASKLRIQLLPRMAFGSTAAGQAFAVVTLATDSGGSGTFVDLATVVDEGGTPTHRATVSLGDRAQVKGLQVQGSEISVQLLTHGPDDPMCCPKQMETRRYLLTGDQLVPVVQGAAEWVGVTWEWLRATAGDGSETLVGDPAGYTLALATDGSVALRVDCNRAFGTYVAQGAALRLEVKGMTRAACPADSMSDAYLEYLSQVTGWTLVDGQLLLQLESGGTLAFGATAASN